MSIKARDAPEAALGTADVVAEAEAEAEATAGAGSTRLLGVDRRSMAACCCWDRGDAAPRARGVVRVPPGEVTELADVAELDPSAAANPVKTQQRTTRLHG